jgi:hypothetical protein
MAGERAHEGQDHKKKGNMLVVGGVATEDVENKVGNDRYVMQRFTRKGEALVAFDQDVTVTATNAAVGTVGEAAPASASQSGGLTSATAPAYPASQLRPHSLDTDGSLRTKVEAAQGVHDAEVTGDAIVVGARANATADTPDEGDMGQLSMDLNSNLRTRVDQAQAVAVGARANATADTPDEGDLSQLSVDLTSNLRTRVDLAQGTHDSAAPSQILMQGQFAETTVPAAVADGDAVRPNFNEYGEPRDAAFDYSALATRIVDPSPALQTKIGPLSFTQIDEPGVTAATNCRPYKNFCWQCVVGGSPVATTLTVEGSHDNSNWFDVTIDSTAKENMAVANNIATISAAGTFEVRGSRLATAYIRLKVMGTSGSPDIATVDCQLILGN